MRKIFQIANYDFKRLITNPITIITMIVILAISIITGFVYKIPNTPTYSASTSGQTTKEIFTNFNSTSTSLDTQEKLYSLITEAENLITVQQKCFDYNDLLSINTTFQSIFNEVKKYNSIGSCQYDKNISDIEKAAQDLKDFVDNFKNLDEFESDIVFKTQQFNEMDEISNYFLQETTSSKPISTKLTNLYQNSAKFTELNNIVNNVQAGLHINDTHLQELQTNYINKAKTKCQNIYKKMEQINNSVFSYDEEYVNEMKSLITSYKLTCESAKYSIIYEFKIALKNHLGTLDNLYLYTPIEIEDAKLVLTKTNYYLNDENLYYSQHQTALNFNTASYQTTMYDYSYFVMSIVGFLVIIFGIFCAYKLFGRDRKKGKIDIILSQNVTFGQVFTAKFLAIILTTSFILSIYLLASLALGWIVYGTLPNVILTTFNLSSIYTIHPFLFLLIKVMGIELQVIFWAIITVFLMNISRKFHLSFAIALLLFATATICNIFLNGSLVYCLFPFIHADLTSFLGGATMQTGFLKTSLYTYGNFFISLAYYLVVVVLLFSFTKQLFKKN